jgi:hypothetical protein
VASSRASQVPRASIQSGDLIGSGEAQERGIVGENPNLAARFQAMGLGGAATGFGRRPLRGAARERLTALVGREEGLKLAAAALVEGKDRRRPSSIAFRRAGHR